ncbi:phosphodiester glycosidase family protein, partial [Bacillus toyonensis]
YLPNAWIVTANQKQEIRVTIDGEKIDTKKSDEFDANISTDL